MSPTHSNPPPPPLFQRRLRFVNAPSLITLVSYFVHSHCPLYFAFWRQLFRHPPKILQCWFLFKCFHGRLINYKDTKAKYRYKKLPVEGFCGRCLLEFIDWRYSQSCWYFRPSFVNYCPSNLSSSPSPSLCQSTLYTCVAGREWGGGGSVELCWRPYSAWV